VLWEFHGHEGLPAPAQAAGGLEVGAGLGPMKGKIWRVGLMGETSSAENVQRCLTALKQILKR
jgi:alanine-glyoxylate transaminase/serine-glyoxylate transaminase/serine-pyruvate transaminase